MNFHSRARASAYLIIIHLALGVILNSFFFKLSYHDLLKLMLIPMVLFDASTLGFFLVRGSFASSDWKALFGGPSKVIGLLVWALVLFGELILFKRTDPLWVYIAISVLILMRFKGNSIPDFDKDEFFASEFVFMVVFYGVLVMMSFFPEIYSGEKAMDANFLGYYQRFESGPVFDPWFPQKEMGYYTFGYFTWGQILKVFSLPVSKGYHVILALVAALLTQTIYSLYSMVSSKRVLKILASWTTFLVPSLSAVWISYSADVNFDSFWNRTRVYPGGFFAEYPLWSFSFGDIHPHVMNYPLIACFLFFIFLIFKRKRANFEWHCFLPLGLVWGSLMITNLWDALLIAALVAPLFFYFFIRERSNLTIIFLSATLSAAIILVGIFQMGQGVTKRFYFHILENGYWQASLLHGGWLILLGFTLYLYKREAKDKSSEIGIWLLTGLGLIFVGSHCWVAMDQLNTIFKSHTFIFLVASTLMMLALLKYKVSRFIIPLVLVFSLVEACFALRARNYARLDARLGPTLDGSRFLLQSSRADFQIVSWINEEVRGAATTIEFPGKSFSYGTPRVAMLTGLSTYLGWNDHVGIRGASAQEIAKREREIKNFYESSDVLARYEWARKNEIKYIVLGELEYRAYSKATAESFDRYEDLFKIRVREGRSRLYEVNLSN